MPPAARTASCQTCWSGLSLSCGPRFCSRLVKTATVSPTCSGPIVIGSQPIKSADPCTSPVCSGLALWIRRSLPSHLMLSPTHPVPTLFRNSRAPSPDTALRIRLRTWRSDWTAVIPTAPPWPVRCREMCAIGSSSDPDRVAPDGRERAVHRRYWLAVGASAR